MRITAFVLSLLSAVALTAQVQIERMYPERGTVGGGDVVTIVTNLIPGGLCDPWPCGTFPTVTFGGVPARDAINNGGIITVITPAHARGSVPVHILVDNHPRLAGTFTFVDAQDAFPAGNYVHAVVPVLVGATPVPGAHGSLWTSELWAANDGRHRVEVVLGVPSCGAACAGQPFAGLEPGETRRIDEPGSWASASRVLFIQSGGAHDVTLSLRIRDVSRSDDNHGTEIPLPKDASDFRPTISVVNVPIDSRSRAALRVYSHANHVQQLGVRVDVFTMPGAQKVASKVITLSNPAGLTGTARFDYAHYGIIADLRSEFPTLPEGSYRLQLTSTAPSLIHPLAALVSVTNNRTQLVTAIASY